MKPGSWSLHRIPVAGAEMFNEIAAFSKRQTAETPRLARHGIV
jgi:hypothetical protein